MSKNQKEDELSDKKLNYKMIEILYIFVFIFIIIQDWIMLDKKLIKNINIGITILSIVIGFMALKDEMYRTLLFSILLVFYANSKGTFWECVTFGTKCWNF